MRDVCQPVPEWLSEVKGTVEAVCAGVLTQVKVSSRKELYGAHGTSPRCDSEQV